MLFFNTKLNCTAVMASVVAALLTACGGQNTPDTASSSTQKTAQTVISSTYQSTQTMQSSVLLASLAATYPNGQIQAVNATQAAKEFEQNPAALKLTAQTAQLQISAQSAGALIQSQATSADYKAVTRIQNTTLTGAYFFTIYDTEQAAALAGNPNWKLEGPAFWASLASGTGLNPVHRFRNNINGSYLYTIYETEKADIQANYASTFFYEGVAWYAQQSTGAGWSPLYRFRNLLNGTYLFSAFEAEKDAIVADYSAVFKLEGVAYYVRQDAAPRYELVSNGSGGYYDKTECVRDNTTGLIWQGQTAAGTGLRGNDKKFTNYDSTGNQIFNLGIYIPATQTQIDSPLNSGGFKIAVNASNLCGSSAWRLPTRGELSTLRKTGVNPNIDGDWFPNTTDLYWTSSTWTSAITTTTDDSIAWLSVFYTGADSAYAQRRGSFPVRLVR
jgi:Protein of unknown function (DUF1566)/Repeat of unknown function (DUF5648)